MERFRTLFWLLVISFGVLGLVIFGFCKLASAVLQEFVG